MTGEKPIDKKIEIVTQQIKYCEEQLEQPNCDVDLLTNQLTLRRQLLKTFQGRRKEAV